jgi:hypothetical protein
MKISRWLEGYIWGYLHLTAILIGWHFGKIFWSR